jgi:uncharacterized protein YbcV (DUF1398 family)
MQLFSMLVKSLELPGTTYTVDVSSSTILYRFTEGQNVLHPGNIVSRPIAETFDQQATIRAIKNNQHGKTDYPTFMEQIAEAGVRFYEATLIGSDKRVTYIGTCGFYEETIPW